MSESSTQERTAVKRDWTKGSILNNLLLLSWPMVIMETLWMLSQMVDILWVGRLGSKAIAGVGVAGIVAMMVMAMDLGIIMGIRAMVTRFIGAKDYENARKVAGQAYLFGAVWGSFVSTVGFFLAGPLMNMFGIDPDVAAEGTAYLRVLFGGWILVELLIVGLYTIQSTGDSLKPMLIECTIRTLHITLCPFLVLGLWVFPPLGTAGAALSNVISQAIGASIGIWLLTTGRTRIQLKLQDFRFIPNLAWRMLKIGIPALIMDLQRSFGNLVLTWFIIPFGTIPVAAHSLASRVEMFLGCPGFGLGGGAGVLVGQNLGAHQPGRAKKGAWLAVILVEAITLVFSVVILILAEKIVAIFSPDPALIEVGSLFLRIGVLGYLLAAVVLVLQAAIAGAGDTLPNMIFSIAMIWLIQMPLAFILPKFGHLGVYGIRWAIVAGVAAGAIAYIVYFQLGRWKSKKV
jgi:putative MATE family efflux protein